MSTPKTTTQNIGNFLATEETYAPPSIVVEEAILKNWHDEYARSIQDPDAFWAGDGLQILLEQAVDQGE